MSLLEKIKKEFGKSEPEEIKKEIDEAIDVMPSSWQYTIFHEQPICRNCNSKILIETASYMGINWRCFTCKSTIDYGSEPFAYTPPKRTADDA